MSIFFGETWRDGLLFGSWMYMPNEAGFNVPVEYRPDGCVADGW